MKDAWQQRIEDEIAKARHLGKPIAHEPMTAQDWARLRVEFPSSLYASWYVLTGRKVTHDSAGIDDLVSRFETAGQP